VPFIQVDSHTAELVVKNPNLLLHDKYKPANNDLVVAIVGALALYLDFINLFLFLLRLFGGRRN
jgi:FtsH-binding integral membrane protein